MAYVWPKPNFPEGVRYYKAIIDVRDSSGRPVAGTWQMEHETPLYWPPTGSVITNEIAKRALDSGYAEFYAPYGDQYGFTTGAGGAIISEFGTRFEVEPTRTSMMAAAGEGPGGRYVIVRLADGVAAFNALTTDQRAALGLTSSADNGIPIKVGGLTDIGAWPHSVTSTPTTPTPTPGGSTSRLVETPAGSGIYRRV